MDVRAPTQIGAPRLSDAPQHPSIDYQHRAIVQSDRDWLGVASAICALLIALSAIVFGVWYFVHDKGVAESDSRHEIAEIKLDVAETKEAEAARWTSHEDEIKERRSQVEASQARTGQRLDGIEAQVRTQTELSDRLSYRMASQEARSEQLGTTLGKISEALADQRTESARQFAEISGQIDGIRQLFERIERQQGRDDPATPPKPSR